MQDGNSKMNPNKKTDDDSTESQDIMLQRNETDKTDKSNGVQESILLPGGNESSPPSNRVDDWRDLAQQIQQETDSSKIVNLVQQLIAKFDEQNSRLPRKQAK
jgi:hypothetical protein